MTEIGGGSGSVVSTGGVTASGSSSGGGPLPPSGGSAFHTGGLGPQGSGGAPPSGGAPSSGGSAPMGGSGGSSLAAGSGGAAIGGSANGASGGGGESAQGGAAGSQGEEAGTAGWALEAGGTAGGAGAPLQPEGMECTQASDCRLVRASCDCVAVPLGDPALDGEGPPCDFDPCTEYSVTEEDVACLRGRRSVGYACGFDGVICEPAPPKCADGQTPSVRDGCWCPCVPRKDCMPSTWGNPDGPLIAGVWLIGWEGDMLHYSVLRFSPGVDTDLHGQLEFLAEPTTLGGMPSDAVDPYFDYSGIGLCEANERPRS